MILLLKQSVDETTQNQVGAKMQMDFSTRIKFHYDRQTLTPGIFHIGVGAFHRSHQALYLQELIEKGLGNSWALSGCGIIERDSVIHQQLEHQNCLYTLIERADSQDEAKIIGSILEHILGTTNPQKVFERMADPNIKIVSTTVTEGGYCTNAGTGDLDEGHAGVIHDLENPTAPNTVLGYLAEGLAQRQKSGSAPFTVLCCDNIQGNGHAVKKMLTQFASLKDPKFARWIEEHVAFPNSMVDRITPATTDTDKELAFKLTGLNDDCPVVCEPFRQWIIEDQFSGGRPKLEEVGVQFVTDVTPYEKMKIRLLNATHSSMGYLGYLLGYRYIHEIGKDADFGQYLLRLMADESAPTVGAVPGIDLTWYQQSILERFSNSNIKDTALRICMDGSAKIPKFVLPIIRDQLKVGGSISQLTLCVAAWMRFLYGTDEAGADIPLNDPIADRLRAVALEAKDDANQFLKLEDIFGDLAKNEIFSTECSRLLKNLWKIGARKTLINLKG